MQPAAQAAGCFCCPADGELAHRTTDNENRQEVRRTDGCMIPKGLPGPPRAAPRCRKRSAAESRPQILPGLVRDGDIGFQGIVVFVTGEGHFHRTNTKRTIDFDFSPKYCVFLYAKNFDESVRP
jgi:hypothetical protein